MNKAFEKILERLILESSSCKVYKLIKPNIEDVAEFNAYKKCIEIVKEVAEEYKSTEHINCYADTSTNTSTNGWISCIDRLPENNKEVLCYAKSTARGGDVIFIGAQDNGCWFLQTAADTMSYPTQYKVIAWMPLPEQYKESD